MAILFGLTSSQVTTILDNLQLLNDSLREAEKVGLAQIIKKAHFVYQGAQGAGGWQSQIGV